MAKQIPFSEVLNTLRDRGELEAKLKHNLAEATCSCCKRKMIDMGTSRIVGVCQKCVCKAIQVDEY